ncbi:hypothetical protein PHLCEN_2v2768 [Hermanssonia centrifuga]|uniref:Uncharacterized protein n=1 Tax=Hermanssonia centrifuga TaxID=98765 RepID=A0A2R6RHV8_9APHY|nr:hypothetical protein PHLCEN_2v2768 [Hermanssonia centrifuga]
MQEEAKPLVPENVVDAPAQRLYYVSLGALCQAIKIFDFFRYLFVDGSSTYTIKWLAADFLYCVCLWRLRIPRLNYSLSVVSLLFLLLTLLDGFMFGGITVNVGIGGSWSMPSVRLNNPTGVASTAPSLSLSDFMNGFGLGSLVGHTGSKDAHLLGQHTVRMSPISTAYLNPYAQTFCISPSDQHILIPVLLNNTNPTILRYTLTPLGYAEDVAEQDKSRAVGKVDRVDLSAKDLKAIENSRLESLQIVRAPASSREGEDFDEYDEDDDEAAHSSRSSFNLQKSQVMVHIRLNKPGVLRLDRVLDSSNVDARLVYPAELPIVPCPRAAFSDASSVPPGDNTRCASPGLTSGAGEDLEMKIDTFGVPPLSLRWYREINGKRESFMVEGIEGRDYVHANDNRRLGGVGRRAPEHLTIPLTMSLNALGTHTYVLETVSDALGNVIDAGIESRSIYKTTRSVSVLRRPSIAFKHCGPGNPASLLIGSETALTLATKEADTLDAPWDVTVKYRPTDEDDGTKGRKRRKPWTKTLTTSEDRRELVLYTDAPGEYQIDSLKGRYCDGDVLSPDTCRVIERPFPTAEIEWKKIHECTQRDKEAPRERAQTFPSSRGELTIQPERSGHYSFNFIQMSDANYQKIDLKGPSIDQIIHPPASADFVHNAGGARGRKRISSCSGNMVDVDVELRGTGPWNLDVQVVGPKGSDIIHIAGITEHRKTLQIAIPPVIDRDGGSFEIDLVSVEDAYGCRRSLSVPGVAVNVRRVKPTVKFYGAANKRHVTILEGERATLPLRLTGDGPWRLKYRRAEAPHQIFTDTLTTANDALRVADKGLYEIVEVSDSQCPGSVVPDSSTYLVDWVPRPSARLSPDVKATYEPYNGSHILPPICEGLNDHVDLDLKGRPPFQIMYNVARDSEAGGTKILDQPTFSSIQPSTRFQLHTSEPARIYYEVKQIGDAAYPLNKNKNAIIPRSERLLFEQQVLMRPVARFQNKKRITYCLNDALIAHEHSGLDGAIALSGTPPFQLRLSIRNLAASEVYHETFEVHDYTWKLQVPSYIFRSIGPHLVTIEGVQDASHCEQAAPDPLSRSIWLDVAETAAIVPFDRREHFCVGEMSQFQLEGTPPWTIGYRVGGKAYTQEAKMSPFSIIQQKAGEFAVTSIAHQQQMCKTAVTDLRYTVHHLPSAQVGHGKRIVQDIHEGDQAEIVFTLIGEPPFTFTYQRADLPTKKGVQGKVLETHTVSGVTTKEYSIFSALEGTWTVTFISDRYCRYPPAQPGGTVEKSRR